MAKKLCLGCMTEYDDNFTICPYCGYVEGAGAVESYHLAPGTILQGKYVVGRSIGHGGFGVTYIGYDAQLRRRIAIKEYLPTEFSTRCNGELTVSVFSGDKEKQFLEGIQQFCDEAAKLKNFQHVEGVVKVYDSFIENNTAYIVMEYLRGETLKEKLKREKGFSYEKALKYIIPVLDSLTELHKVGLLHRDIAPDNIFITKDGEVKLIDFGAARYATGSLSKSLSVIVKQGYAPVEQYRSHGLQGSWTDVYACAATLYKMITGRAPEDAMERSVNDELLPPSKLGVMLPKNAETAIMNALNLEAEDRTESAEKFKAELLATDVTVKRKEPKVKKQDTGRWPTWVKIAIAVATSALLFFGLWVLFFKPSPPPPSPDEIPEGYQRVPYIINTGISDAERKAEDSTMIIQIMDKDYSDEIPENEVLRQTPADGTLAKKGSVIELVVSGGKEKVFLIDVTGMEKEEGERRLKDIGLNVSVEEKESKEVAPGYIISQSIPEGEQAEKGSTVTIVVSKGSTETKDENVKVPDFRGKSWEEATALANENKLYIYKADTVYSDTVPKNQVINQNTAPGTEVKAGTTVGVTVSLGKEMVRVPDVQFKDKQEAIRVLEESGLSVKTEDVESYTVAKDHVVSQSIAPGTEVERGSSITISVSLGNKKADKDSEGTITTAPNDESSNKAKDEITKAPKDVITETPKKDIPVTTAPKKYSVTFDANGGSSPSQASITVTSGSTYGTLASTSRTGYTFSGWYTAASGGSKIDSSSKVNISSNQTVYAHWTARKFKVSFKNFDGTSLGSDIEVTYGLPYGDVLQISCKYDYVFDGWYADINRSKKVYSTDIYLLTENQTLYGEMKLRKIVMPNTVGETEEEAKNILKSHNLVVGNITYSHDTSKTSGTVLSQSVASGTSIEVWSMIDIVVCDNSYYTEYRYKNGTYEYKSTNTKGSLGTGWEYVNEDSSISYGEWGAWSGWSRNAVSKSDTRDVQSEFGIQLGQYRAPDGSDQEDHYVAGWNLYEYDFPLSEISKADPFQWEGSITERWLCAPWGIMNQVFYHNAQGINWTWSGTLYRYRDRSKTVTYTYNYRKLNWGSWSSWSTTYVSANATRQVETRKVYNY